MKVHTRSQVMYSLDIGSASKNYHTKHSGVQAMADTISKIVGGCTLVDSVGYWADVERADKESYHEFLVGRENNVQLQVKGETQKEELLEETIVTAVVCLARAYPELGINWVCGHKVTRDGLTVAFNFSVEENNQYAT